LGHHVIIWCRSLLNLGASMLAEHFAAGPKIGFVNLAIVPYNINDYVVLICELRDVWFHPMMVQRFSNALTNATVVAGVIGNPLSSVSFLHHCL
jgi:hypothetical protein